MPPGALDHWHTHPPRVGYVLSGAKIRVTEADGTHEDYDEKSGDVYWGDFSPLHDTLNVDTSPYIALLVEVKAALAGPASADEAAIRGQRAAFNTAIAKGDLAAIGAVLADNAQIVTGADSLVFNGRDGELELWAEDLAAPSRGIYVRTPDRIDFVARRADGDGDGPLARRRHDVGQGLVVGRLFRQVAAHGRQVADRKRDLHDHGMRRELLPEDQVKSGRTGASKAR